MDRVMQIYCFLVFLCFLIFLKDFSFFYRHRLSLFPSFSKTFSAIIHRIASKNFNHYTFSPFYKTVPYNYIRNIFASQHSEMRMVVYKKM